jgi:hypothetical protein
MSTRLVAFRKTNEERAIYFVHRYFFCGFLRLDDLESQQSKQTRGAGAYEMPANPSLSSDTSLITSHHMLTFFEPKGMTFCCRKTACIALSSHFPISFLVGGSSIIRSCRKHSF